jgi:hypothetical protein
MRLGLRERPPYQHGDHHGIRHPRPGQAGPLWAAPAVLAPHQPGRPAEAPQVDQLNHGAILDPGPHAAGLAPGRLGLALDMHTDRLAGLVVDGEDGHVGQADEERTRA